MCWRKRETKTNKIYISCSVFSTVRKVSKRWMITCKCFVSLCCHYHGAASLPDVRDSILDLPDPYIQGATGLPDIHVFNVLRHRLNLATHPVLVYPVLAFIVLVMENQHKSLLFGSQPALLGQPATMHNKHSKYCRWCIQHDSSDQPSG